MRQKSCPSRRERPWLLPALVKTALSAALALLTVSGQFLLVAGEALEIVLESAGDNRPELEKALASVPPGERPSFEWILESLGPRDARELRADFLLENHRLAHEALRAAPWGEAIPQEVFLDAILPFASLDERRDRWRASLRERCLPLVAGAKSPAEAAQRLNEKLFGLVGVKYSTQRKRADQSPIETMESGLASCTGLSILLVAACRSVAVPARVAGIPNWVDKRGNHTWVEVWDDGWHFTGAAEPDGRGLDHAWFEHDASLAIEGSREHAIYAATLRKTGLTFPLVWSPGSRMVNAIDVTTRYKRKDASPSPDVGRLLVRVVEEGSRQRVAARVVVTSPDDAGLRLEGTSRDERFDLNDILALEVPRDLHLSIRIEGSGKTAEGASQVAAGAQKVVTIVLGGGPVAPPVERLSTALRAYFSARPEARAAWRFDPELEGLLLQDEPATRELAWRAYRQAPIHEASRAQFEAHEVRSGDHVSPYTLREVGSKPPGGWPLFIAMHGGGGTTQEVNDSQWRIMQRYYRDQDSVPGYLYLALRAPNNEWNGFYADYVYPLIEALIQQLVLLADVDPDKVFILGYSHGGYGAFAIGPKIPDRFAAIHSSAAAPTDGETSPRTLRNTIFTFMIGENDRAYGRIDRCKAFAAAIERLRGSRSDIYPVTMELRPGFGHGGLPDRDKILGMYPAVRNVVPRELSWELTDTVVQRFFWLEVPEPAKGKEVEASCLGNAVVLRTRGIDRLRIWLDGRLVDVHRPVTLDLNGEVETLKLTPGLVPLAESLLSRGDPRLVFTCVIEKAVSATSSPEEGSVRPF